jgi:cytochrome c oxidase subunit II
MNPHLVLVALIALGVIWTAAWAFVLVRSRRQQPAESLEQPERRVRVWLLVVLASIGLGLFALSVRWLPYRTERVAELGAPRIAVKVVGVQWGWALSRTSLPVGVPVEFSVTTPDVNHDFAIYDADGVLRGQVQVMPGYTNRLVYVFRKPGAYTIRCLEYCGVGHHTMTVPLTITAGDAR